MPEDLDLKYNPLKFVTRNLDYLHKIELQLLKYVDEFAEKESLSEKAKKELKQSIKAAIKERKVEEYFQNKLLGFSERLVDVMDTLITSDTKQTNYNDKDLFYVKNTRHSVTYE